MGSASLSWPGAGVEPAGEVRRSVRARLTVRLATRLITRLAARRSVKGGPARQGGLGQLGGAQPVAPAHKL